MSYLEPHKSSRRTLTFALLFSAFPAFAQPAGLLYDPEPPADSAYVRVIHTGREGGVDVLIDGRVRAKKLNSGEASEYLVLSSGKHSLVLQPVTKGVPTITATIDAVRGRATTVAFSTLNPDSAPMMFDDKANSNKLKALLAVYHLDAKIGPLDVLTADGSTKVFTGLLYGSPASIQVNPISIDLISVKSGDKVTQTKTSLAMSQGGTYSLFILPGASGKVVSNAVQNKTERFTGK
jgi:alginate O-acetyltransferase complex protein AlgF